MKHFNLHQTFFFDNYFAVCAAFEDDIIKQTFGYIVNLENYTDVAKVRKISVGK